MLETERRGNDSSRDGDIEDIDGMDTERRNRREDVRVMYNLPNKISGSVETNSMDSEYFKKKGVNKGFPLN